MIKNLSQILFRGSVYIVLAMAIFTFSTTQASAASSKTVVSENEWTVKIQNGEKDWYDTGISFEIGDQVKITDPDGITSKYAFALINGKERSTSGLISFPVKETLKLKSTNTAFGTVGWLTLSVKKTPAGTTAGKTNTNTNATTSRTVDETVPKFNQPGPEGSVAALIAKAIRVLMATIAIASVVVIVIAGFRLVLQGDSETARTSAKKSITWAILGLIFALMSFSIVTIIQTVLQP